MPQDFRTLDGADPSLSFETRLAVSYVQTVSANIQELVESELAPLPQALPRIRLGQDAEQAGESERRRLGVELNQQLDWTAQAAFRNWRTIIESAGVFVLLKKFPLDDCRGFTIFEHRSAPIIVINKAEVAEQARTFTLVHEYAHLLLREPGLSDLNERNPVEAFCNRFAAGFLMPRALLRSLMGRWPNEPQEWTDVEIRDFARRLKVSQQSVALRLETLGLARRGFFDRFAAGQPAAPRPRATGGSYVNTQVNELGDRFTKTVLDANLADTEASDILDLRPVHFPKIRARIAEQRARLGLV